MHNNNKIIRELNKCKLLLIEDNNDEEFILLITRIVELISELEYDNELLTDTNIANRNSAES